MRRINIIISLVIIIFGAYYSFLITGLPDRNLPNTLGVSFMPWLLVLFLWFLAGFLLVKNLTREPNENCNPAISRREGVGIVLLIVMIPLYVRAMMLAGFLLTTPIVLIILMLMCGARRWREIVIFSRAVTGMVYLLFRVGFRVQLPMGKIF